MTTRLYGLWELDEDTEKWTRSTWMVALPKEQAVEVFQSALLAGVMGAGPQTKLEPVGHQLDRGYFTQRAHLNTLRNDV